MKSFESLKGCVLFVTRRESNCLHFRNNASRNNSFSDFFSRILVCVFFVLSVLIKNLLGAILLNVNHKHSVHMVVWGPCMGSSKVNAICKINGKSYIFSQCLTERFKNMCILKSKTK